MFFIVLNLEGTRFSGGPRSLETFWFEFSAVSNSRALINPF